MCVRGTLILSQTAFHSIALAQFAEGLHFSVMGGLLQGMTGNTRANRRKVVLRWINVLFCGTGGERPKASSHRYECSVMPHAPKMLVG